MTLFKKLSLTLTLLFCAGILTAQQPSLPPDVGSAVDDLAHQTLARTGVPSASIGIVRDGRITYLNAYGSAHLDPAVAAQPGMRYSIGSISKQFTAAAILLLAEQGKLSLDDPVAKYVPNLTRGDEVTIRQVLSHTSGYQDYWPQDYVPPLMLKPTSASAILDMWARKPLDFEPGTRWQYSNTNYVIAGLIIEKVSGVPLFQFLSQNIFNPLGMKSVGDIDKGKLPESDATGYFRYALGPLRPAPKEGPGWLFAAGELAMTAQDLCLWDISMIRQSVLKPDSYKTMETEVRLKNGGPTRYGLGLSVGMVNGHRSITHGGEVSGYTSTNIVLPDDGIAVVVLTNQDAIGASGQIARAIVTRLLAPQSADPKEDDRIRSVLLGFSKGEINRSLFTDNANAYFTEQALRDYAGSLRPLGDLLALTAEGSGLRGGMSFHNYRAQYAGKSVNISVYQLPDGKIEQYLIQPRED